MTSDPSDELVFSGVWLSAVDNQHESQVLQVTTSNASDTDRSSSSVSSETESVGLN